MLCHLDTVRLHEERLIGSLWSCYPCRDHAGGNDAIARRYPGVMIAGPEHERIPARNHPVNGGDEFKIGAANVQVLNVSCHTKAHVAYVVTGDAETPPLLFPGDTLFVGGCGRFFEGTAEDMYRALYDVILTLPKDTRVYCGHEYTMSNFTLLYT